MKNGGGLSTPAVLTVRSPRASTLLRRRLGCGTVGSRLVLPARCELGMQLTALIVRQDAFDLLVQRPDVGSARLRIGVFVFSPRAFQDVRDLLLQRGGELEPTHRMQVTIVMAVVLVRNRRERRGTGNGNGLRGCSERQCERGEQCKRTEMMSKHG